MSENQKLKIKEWAVEDRPREKLLVNGRRALTDAELMAIIIGSGNRDETALELSKRILKAAGNNLDELGKKNPDFFYQFKGVGQAKAINIIAALELGHRLKLSENSDVKKISSSQNVVDIIMPLLRNLEHEEFWILLLNQRNVVVHKFMASKGGITSMTVDVRTIMKTAVEKSSVSMILCHNHPSGSTAPSEEDYRITQKLQQAGNLLDIRVLDHIIIGGNNFYSFGDHGKI